MNDEISNAQRRAARYAYVDGSVEFFLGGLCLLLGVYFYLNVILPEGSMLSNLLNASLMLVIFGGFFVTNRLIRRFKERITYPRSGYVAYRQASGANRLLRRLLAGVIAVLISGVITLLFTNYRLGAAWMPAVTGIIFGVVLGIMAFRSGLVRLYLLALIAVVIGGGLMLNQVGDTAGLAAFYGLMAAALLASGSCTLVQYLRHTPLPEGDNEP